MSAVVNPNFQTNTQPAFKKGGEVKKHSTNKTVKSNASKRADGIAIKGKTRA